MKLSPDSLVNEISYPLIGLYGWVRIIRSIQYGYPIRIPFKISGTEFI